MKKLVSILLLCLLFSAASLSPEAFAGPPVSGAVSELWSEDGHYVDDVGNSESFSFHVPQINADTADAASINAEIAERFGSLVEQQYQNMEGGYSLWSWHTEWKAYWYSSQLFLLITSDYNGGFEDYSAYGYDFDTGKRVTNEMILSELGINEEEYLENLREKVQFMFEDMYGSLSPELKDMAGLDQLLEKTLGWLDLEQPMFIDQFGGIETIVKIASVAGAEWYYHLATPFSFG